ncbi:hypothetical protein [Bifidobacterium tibiigranuli]|jgi:hypothetical protein|uniref:hypothetical protein n=1 Tax=Bifidobacterium tibiigranuli TaxID=2172043 RepID=UPI0026F138CC|nr:hypothetical protein [Bifidobacterium tibiigranuli]MCI2203016.1 hypothetical protein [Bifidobacterium tibiigranuli]
MALATAIFHRTGARRGLCDHLADYLRCVLRHLPLLMSFAAIERYELLLYPVIE